MFSKFTSILQHAVDALAPQLSLQEEFVFHWKAITNFFIDNKGEKLPIEQTSIPAHLEQMLVILQQEDCKCDRGMYGPCLEYLLQHKLLETLNSLGRTDYPPGMKQIVLSFFTKLLSRIKQPLLAHVNVYRAVQRLIKTCGEVKAGPSEIEEIQFLCTVCAKIKADPYLVNFFLEIPKSSSSTLPDSKGLVVDEPISENKLQQEFHLINTLLTLSHSEDSRVAVKACEGLILCSSLPDPIAAHCLVNSTQFCDDFTQRLIDTYKKLPKEINPLDLENVQAKWGMDVVTKREDEITFAGKRYLISFLSWLDYCDQLSTIANPIVAEALARTIHQKFLIAYFQPDLLQISEIGCIASMAYMSRCLRTVCSQRLLSELVLFLLGDERKPEVPGETKDTLRCRLVERCNSVSEEVCLITLQLFDTLLQKDDEHIHHNLVLRNLTNRQYLDSKSKVRESDVETPKENDEGCKHDDKTVSDESDHIPQPDSQIDEPKEISSGLQMISPPNTPQHVKTEVHKIVNSFLTLLPEDLKSSYQTVDGGYDMYLKDAHKQYSAMVEACKTWGYPHELTPPTDNDSGSFYEGSFLHMVLDKFSHLLDQSYSINLQLTSVISKLALIPHPCLQEFLLDPFLPLKPGIRNLFSIFVKVSNEIKSQNASEPELFRKLVTVRKKLMGNATSMQSVRRNRTGLFERMDDESRLEAIIVFEEFCKELSAIVFVKHHASITEEKKS